MSGATLLFGEHQTVEMDYRKAVIRSMIFRRIFPAVSRERAKCFAGDQKDAGIKKKPHRPSRKRVKSASSSAAQAAIYSLENLRGSGSLTPCARNRVARKSINSCFSSGGKDSAAASISSSLLTAINYHANHSLTTIQSVSLSCLVRLSRKTISRRVALNRQKSSG